jgi:hypothetical protein
MVAMLDKNQNYKFDPRSDKIGFVNSLIEVPSDENYKINIFKEILDFEIQRPKQLAKHHLIFGYKGNPDSTKISLLSEHPSEFDYRIIKDSKKDTLHYWYKPFMEVDSLVFKVDNQKYTDTVYTKIKDMLTDSLEVNAVSKGTINVNEKFKLTANLPLEKLDTAFVKIMNKDSIFIPFKHDYQSFENTYSFDFEKEEKQAYQIQLFPGALTDFYEHTNDTLSYNLRTPNFADLGVLNMKIENIKSYPVIVQLTNNKDEIYKEIIHQEEDGNLFTFNYINPGSYFMRIIYDENDNGKWDTGSYLNQKQAEEIIYFPKEIEVRANWDVVETFRLK